MAHIVVLVGDYYPVQSANGICVDMLIKQMQRSGHTIDVICNGKRKQSHYTNVDGVEIHTVNGEIPKGFLKKGIRKALSYPRLIYWPVRHPWKIKQMVNLFDTIYQENSVDCLIVVQKPVESSMSGRQIIKKYPHVKSALYVLDSVANNLDVKHGYMKLFRRKSERAELSVHSCFQAIFHMEFNDFYYGSRDEYAPYRGKITYLNLPLISQKIYQICESERVKAEPRNVIRFLYAGVLNVGFRDPSLFMQLLSRVSTTKDVVCDFYTRADLGAFNCEAYREHRECFIRHAYIPQSEMYSKFANSDFLVSIGNPCSDTVKQVPSKVYTYMSTGMPIIHILGGKNDICIDVLSRYENCLLLDPDDEFNTNLSRLNQFIELNCGKIISFDDIAAKNPHNTPEWSVEQMKKVLEIS